jgi:transposase-like protein
LTRSIELVTQSDRSMSSIVMELGINAKSIGEWVRRAEESGETVEDERAKLKRLCKEVLELRMESESFEEARAGVASTEPLERTLRIMGVPAS